MDFRLTIPSLSLNCWPATPQDLVNEAFSKTRGQLQNLEGIIISQTTPAIDDQDKMWVRVDANGRADGQFIFGSGTWNWENPRAALGDERMLWVGPETDLWSYDGGDGSNPATVTPHDAVGAMWEVDTGPAGRFLAAVGDVPGSDPVAVVTADANVTNTSAGIMLTAAQMAIHTHPLSADSGIEDGDEIKVVDSGGGADTGLLIGASGNASTNLASNANDPGSGTQEAVPIVPPGYGFYVARRTARTHYLA